MNKKAAFDYTWQEIREMKRLANNVSGRRVLVLDDIWDDCPTVDGGQELVCIAKKGEYGTIIDNVATPDDSDFEIKFDNGEWGYAMREEIKILPIIETKQAPTDAPKQLPLFGDES